MWTFHVTELIRWLRDLYIMQDAYEMLFLDEEMGRGLLT